MAETAEQITDVGLPVAAANYTLLHFGRGPRRIAQ